MQMSEGKVGATKSGSTSSSTIKLSYSNRAKPTGATTTNNNNNLSMSSHVTSSASKNDTSLEHNKRTKKKANRDKQPSNDVKPATTVMSNLSYSLIDDDHIDDQETINVGNLIIDLESSLEKEKIENEQANNNLGIESKSSTNAPGARSPTSLSTESDASGSSFTSRQRASSRRRVQPRSPTSMSPCSSSPINSTPSSPSSSNKPNNINSNNNNNDIKPSSDIIGSKSSGRTVPKNSSKLSAKDPININLANAPGAPNNNGQTTTRTVFKSSSDERGELKMKITMEKKTLKSEHKIVASPTQRSPTGCSSSNSGNHITNDGPRRANSHEDLTRPSVSNISSTKECGTSTSIGTITEPECLGPCEPGTSVTLEGIVWQETDGGILVVNVTWRGKTYVGALLDCTRHDWAPPRLCDSPASDIDLKANKGVRGKRIVTRSNGIGLDEKNLLQTTGKLRNGKGRRILPANEPTSCNKKQRETNDKAPGDSSSAQIDTANPRASTPVNRNKESDNMSMEVDTSIVNQEPTEIGGDIVEKDGLNSPSLIGCSEPNCSKKYRNLNGLQYHQSHAHSANSNPSNTHDDSSSPSEDKAANSVAIEMPVYNNDSPNASNQVSLDSQEQVRTQQGQKRERTSSPETPSKHDNRPNNDLMAQANPSESRLPRNDSPRISYVKGMDLERRLSSSSGHNNVPRVPDPARASPNIHQRNQSMDASQGHRSSNLPINQQMSSSSLATLPASRSSSHNPKQSIHQQPPLPATTEEGMKPSGTSTGPPPAPHQANCYFNPAFLANTFNPYSMPPYFPRHLYDQMTPPAIPTSNAAFLARFMNNMRVPPPPDSPSRLLSPSMPKNVPFPPFKIDPNSMPPQIPNSMPNMPPLGNPPLPPVSLPPMPPLSLAGGPGSLRMPSQGDPLLPPSSQTPFLPPGSLNPAMGLSGMGNPLGPLGGPPVPNPMDDHLAKQFPRRFN